MIDRSFSIQTGWDDRHEKLQLAAGFHFGLEVAAFASGPALRDQGRREAMEEEFAHLLAGFCQPLSLHAAFIDLPLHSSDPEVAALAQSRAREDLETASRLGCQKVIFHTGFNPLVPGSTYLEAFTDFHAAFWPSMAEAFPGITICLENQWEPSPSILLCLLARAKHERVRLCLDVAHAHAYSQSRPEIWIEQLAPYIAHMHWNDNSGDDDSHLRLGLGSVRWRSVVAACRQFAVNSTVLLELRSIPDVIESVRFLQTEVFSKLDP